ncbi:2'-5' RNA ligase family protein [Nocardia asteroides]|uniref:2'-5' RNA ligase family protein n=1 Tax=Nocardia asteroides TaxID=1824 RepID=UPI00378A97F4
MTSSGVFPPPLPHSTSNPEAIANHDWNAFIAVDTLRDHWSVKQWAPGHTGYYWYLTLDDPALLELTADYQRKLAHPALDPVPLDGLHITLTGIGSTTTVTDAQIDNLIPRAQERLSDLHPFDLTLGPLTGSRSAVRLSVSPWDPLLELHELLVTSTSESVPSFAHTAASRRDRFRPHLGIAYNNTDRPAADLIEAVAALRSTDPVTVRVDRVDLVVLRREGHSYRSNSRAVVPLGS